LFFSLGEKLRFFTVFSSTSFLVGFLLLRGFFFFLFRFFPTAERIVSSLLILLFPLPYHFFSPPPPSFPPPIELSSRFSPQVTPPDPERWHSLEIAVLCWFLPVTLFFLPGSILVLRDGHAGDPPVPPRRPANATPSTSRFGHLLPHFLTSFFSSRWIFQPRSSWHPEH